MKDNMKYNGKVFTIPAEFSPRKTDVRFVCTVDSVGDLILKEERKYILGYSHPDRYHLVKLYDDGKYVDTFGCTQAELNVFTSSPKCSFGSIVSVPDMERFASDPIHGNGWKEFLKGKSSSYVWMDTPFTEGQKKALRELFYGVGQWDKISKETLIGYEG